MKKILKNASVALWLLMFGQIVLAQTEVTYNFNTAPLLSGITPASGTVEAVFVSGLTDNGIVNNTNILRPKTVGSLNNTGVANLTFIPNSSDYSVTWKEYITAGNTSLKKGFLLRGSGTNTYATGMRQGYYFMVQNNTTTGSVNFRILKSTATTIADIKNSGAITIPGFALNAACWFRASTTGNILKFEYSTDGVTFNDGTTVTDNTYSSGTTQLVYGIGSGVIQYLYDDIKFKALLNSTITATGSSTYAYNGMPQGPKTATVTGSSGAITYNYSGTGSTNYGPSAKPPILVGTYQVVATLAADSSYKSAISIPFSFTINSNPSIPVATLRRSLSPTSPMYMIHVDAWADQPQEIIDLIPQDILPFVVINLSMSTSVLGDRGYDCAESWLNTCAQNGVWAMVQASSGIQNAFATDLDLNSYESLYIKYPNFIGYNFCEQAWGFDTTSFQQRLNLFTNLLEMGHKYGGFLYVNDNFSISGSTMNTIAKFKSNAEFANATKVYKDNMIYGNKFTNSFGFYDNESGALGAFLSGHASNYAVRYDMYSWGWSGKGQVFGAESPDRNPDGNRAIYACPEAVMGVPIVEHLLLTGATVIDGPEVPWMSTLFGTHKLPPFDNMIADILRKILDGTIRIPTVNEVAARTKVVFVNDVDTNTTDSLFSGLYAMDGMLTNNRTWFKKSGRYASIPQLYSDSASETALFSSAVFVKKSELNARWLTEQQKVSEFNSLYPAVSTGDMYVSRVNNSLYAYNPWLNTNTTTTASIPLMYNTCNSVELSYPAHTFSVINESSNKLQIYLNNYRTDKNQLWAEYPNDFSWFRLQNTILPLFATNPPDNTFRTSVIKVNGSTSQPVYTLTDRGSHKASTSSISWANGVYTLTIVHNGPVDITIDCAGTATGRAIAPSPIAMVSPVSPIAYTGEKEYEAEGAIVTSPAAVSSNPVPITYHGTGFVRFSSTSSSNSSVRFNVINAEVAGTYALDIRYAALASVSLVDIFVNGTRVTSPIFPATGGENSYSIFTQNINLNQGTNNVIEFKARAVGAVINFDKITLTKTDSSYYYKGTGSLTNLSSWGRNTNGSGDAPLSFTDDAQIFEIRNTTSIALDGVWTVSGVGSKVRIGNTTHPAITLTLNSSSSIGGGAANVDVIAPVSGNHTVIYKNTAELSYGTVSDSNLAIVYDNASISSSSSNTFGSINIINGSFITYLHRPVVRNLTVDATSVLSAPTGPTNAYIAIPTGGSVVINGRLKIPQLTGFVKSSVGTASSQNGNIQFIGTENFTLGQGSIVEYSGSGGSQIVDVRTDYKNLRFTGTASKAISGGTIVAGTLTVNQAAPAASVTLLGDLTVNGSIVFTSGKITTGVHTLTIGASGTITGASQVTGWVVGNLKKLSNSSASPSFTYTIGDATTYAPLDLTFSGNTSVPGGLTASTVSGDHVNIAGSSIFADKSVNRTWRLTNDSLASFESYSANFTYGNGDNDASVTASNYGVYLYSGSVWSYLTTSNASVTTVTASGITGFGDFAIGEYDTTPVAEPATFCSSVNPTVASLSSASSAIDAKWYIEEVGGSALAPNIALISRIYYVSQTINGVESARTSVEVTVLPDTTTGNVTQVQTGGSYLWAANGTTYTTSGTYSHVVGCNTATLTLTINTPISEIPTTFPSFCKGATIATATGSTSLKFYTAISGTAAAVTSSSALTTRTYFVTQTIAGVESSPRVAKAIVVNNLPTTLTALTSSEAKNICKYIGSSTPVTFTATATGASSYIWTAPTSATIDPDGGQAFIRFENVSTTAGLIGSVTVKIVDANGCISLPRALALTTVEPKAPTALTMTSSDETPHFKGPAVVPATTPATFTTVGLNSLLKITKVGPYMGTETVFTLTAPPASTAASYGWTLPDGVTQLSGGTSNVITVDFAGVPAGIGTLPIRVKSVAGCGSSPDRTLTLARALPTAPTKLVLTDNAVSPITAVTKVGPYTGKTTELTLTATPFTVQGATATSYAWVLPAGVNCGTINTPTTVKVKSTLNTGTVEAPIYVINDVDAIATASSTITINLDDVQPGVASLPISVYAVNGAGNSIARTLTVTTAAPSTPGTITTATLAVPTFNPACSGTTSITVQVPSVFGVSYAWTVGEGASITSGQGTNSVVIDVENVSTPTLAIGVVGSNGTGSSLARSLSIKKVGNCREASAPTTNGFKVSAYPNPSSSEFTIESSAKGAMSVKVYDMQGRLVEKADTNRVGARLAKGVYNVIVNQGANTKSVRVIKK